MINMRDFATGAVSQNSDNLMEVHMQIGFIGLGIMGKRMAANLQKAGLELFVYNRTRGKAAKLVSSGARINLRE